MSVIFDLDGCISDDRWRRHTINGGDYSRYHALMLWDAFVNKDIVEFHSDQLIFVLTARPVHFRRETVLWLKKHFINAPGLMMRDNDDLRNSPEIKQDMLMRLLAFTGQRPGELVAYDDRDDILDMYRSNGVDARQLLCDRRTDGQAKLF